MQMADIYRGHLRLSYGLAHQWLVYRLVVVVSRTFSIATKICLSPSPSYIVNAPPNADAESAELLLDAPGSMPVKMYFCSAVLLLTTMHVISHRCDSGSVYCILLFGAILVMATGNEKRFHPNQLAATGPKGAYLFICWTSN